MAKVFTSVVEMENFVEKVCRTAVMAAGTRLLIHLQDYIEENFYDEYDPKVYERTRQFYEAATMQLLDNMMGMIFMDEGAMSYKGNWSGREQVQAANIHSHGGVFVDTQDLGYWDAFEEFCDRNALTILKEELKKQGIVVK